MKPAFGRREGSPLAKPKLDCILVPKGAAKSKRNWSLAEALDMFIDHATSEALFALSELPAEAVDLWRAYGCAGDLDNQPLSEWLAGEDQVKVEAAGRGFGLIKRADLAIALQGDTEPARYPDSLEIGGLVSRWLRAWPGLVILGDGAKDLQYKLVMGRLHRTNPRFGERLRGRRPTRAQAELLSSGQVGGPAISLDALIREVEDELGG